MGSSALGPLVVLLLKALISWFRDSVGLRLLGWSRLFLTLITAIPDGTSLNSILLLQRLSRILLLRAFVCMHQHHENKNVMSSFSFIGGADNLAVEMACAPDACRSDSSLSRSTALCETKPRSHPRPLSSARFPPPRLPMPHSRSMTTSHVDVVKQGKRLSLQFPIQPAAGGNSTTKSPRSRPQSWVAASPVLSPGVESPASSEPNILAVLAAQERYVLELKEELNKAEIDLKTLKRHYSTYEATKRRNDVRKVAQLQPVNTLIDLSPDKEDEDGSNTSLQQEMERRKALLANANKTQRKVFAGSRHLRTLSLLSPDKNFTPSFPQPSDLQEEEPSATQSEPPTRSSMSSDFMRQSLDSTNAERQDMSGKMPNIQREQIIRAGTQMATDLKNGLFTFIEDIRQATVGDEAVHGPHEASSPLLGKEGSTKATKKAASGRPPLNRSASSKKSTQHTGSFGDDFWKENGLSEPTAAPVNTTKTHTNKPAQTPQKHNRKASIEEEEWDNWETPNDTYGSKTADIQDSSDDSDGGDSGPASSRTSTRYHSKRHDSKASSLTTASSTGYPDDAVSRDGKRNSIPWPDLVKLSPNNLKRTASHLMKEWEKQLTPPPESRNSSHSHGDYIGRTDSPADLI